MNHNKVIFINATFDNNIHEIIDSSLIISLSSIMENSNVYLLKNRRKIIENNIKELHSDYITNVTFHNLYNINKRGAIHDFIAAIIEAYLLLIKGDKKTIFVFSYLNMFSSHLNNLIAKITGKTIICCSHNEIEVIAQKDITSKDYWRFLINHFYTKTQWASNLYLMVLGDSIKNAASKYLPLKKIKNIISIDHPYYTLHSTFDKREFNPNSIKIGIIGTVTPDKGFENIKLLATNLEKEHNITFYILSKINKDLYPHLPSNVIIYNKTNSFIPRNEYENLIKGLDYIFIPYAATSFQMTASGSLLEAIFQNKPILTLKNGYSTYIYNKYGKYGIFIDEKEPRKELINILSNKTLYKEIQKNQQKIIELLSPIRIGKEILKELENRNL